jgi:hypothetical protein
VLVAVPLRVGVLVAQPEIRGHVEDLDLRIGFASTAAMISCVVPCGRPQNTASSLVPQHQPHVLHRRARRALAEIVEPRDQHRLAVLVAGEDVELEHVGLVERLRLELAALGRRVLERHHRDVFAAGVALRQRGVQVGAARLARQRVEMQRHRHQHALPVVADRRHEDRPPRQLRIELRLRQMLVLEAEAIELEGRRGAASKLAIIDLPPPE